MSCEIINNSGLEMGDLEQHVTGMYDFFDQKLGFKKPPRVFFDSDPSNQSNVLGKTAYYDPSSLEVHVFTDGRHPKDLLRSIAHELVHHLQNLEGRLDVGGYMGGAYYESWVTRTVDNLQSMTVPQLHVIEGITGRDGDGGNSNYWGPHPVDAPWDKWSNYGKIEYTSGGTTYYGTSKTFLTNFVLFGIGYAGYHLGENLPEDPERLGEAVVQNTLNLCQAARVNLSEEEVTQVREWIMGALSENPPIDYAPTESEDALHDS